MTKTRLAFQILAAFGTFVVSFMSMCDNSQKLYEKYTLGNESEGEKAE